MATWASGEKITSAKLNRGLILGRARRDSNSSNAASSTEVGVLRLDGLTFKADYLYRISLTCHPASTVSTDVPQTTLRYSTSGAASTSSTVIPGGRGYSDTANPMTLECFLGLGADSTVSILLTIARNSGSGNNFLFADGTRLTTFVVRGEGIDPGDNGVDI